MIISARTLATALVFSTLLSGCFNSSEKNEWQVEPEGEQSYFAVPQKVQNKVDIANVSAEVQVDNNGWEPLTINSGKASGSIKGITAGVHTIGVRFVYDLAGVPIVLTQVVRQVTIVAGSSTRLEFLESDYNFDLFDLDQDGVNNADEIGLGFNPSDPNSFPILNGASSSIVIPVSSSSVISSEPSSVSVTPSSASSSSSSVLPPPPQF